MRSKERTVIEQSTLTQGSFNAGSCIFKDQMFVYGGLDFKERVLSSFCYIDLMTKEWYTMYEDFPQEFS
jgi:hypothetical protein